MKAVILSAAKPRFTDLPIFDVELRGTRLIEAQKHCLELCGIHDITVVLGYGADKFHLDGIATVINPDWSESGSISSMRKVADLLSGKDDLLFVYGDTVFSPALVEEALDSESGIAAVCYLDRQGDDRQAFREFASVQNGRIQAISDSFEGEGIRTVFAGIVLFRRHKVSVVRRYLEEDGLLDGAHVGALLNRMIGHGAEIVPVMVEADWTEVRSRETLAAIEARSDFLAATLPLKTDWSQRAKAYRKLSWVNDDRLLSAIVEMARESAPKKVLDVGTGTGKVLMGLSELLGTEENWGVDLSREMIGQIPAHHGFKLSIDDAESLATMPRDYFDLVTARMVFHHIADTRRAAAAAHAVLRPGGRLIICEGVPPSQRSVEWYTDMFRYKEERNTLPEGDLIQILVRSGFTNISLRSVVMRNASLNNWLDNSGIPQRNIDIIKEMHYRAPSHIKDDYDMTFTGDDCLMTWRFGVVCGERPL
ncbi:MAG: methyltransferase domain-containing protein [Kiloniellales bacterium]